MRAEPSVLVPKFSRIRIGPTDQTVNEVYEVYYIYRVGVLYPILEEIQMCTFFLKIHDTLNKFVSGAFTQLTRVSS